MRIQNEESFQKIQFPKNRQVVLETLQTWALRHPIHGLIEVDVTCTWDFIQKHKALTGVTLSFTGFIISCVGRAVDENKAVQAIRTWNNELILFEDVDLTTVVEVAKGDQKYPKTHIIRAANRKTFQEIHTEIREVQAAAGEQMPGKRRKRKRLFLLLPAFVRRIFYRTVRKNPRWMKKHVGTVALTAVGMFGEGGGWGVPIAVTPLFITIGGITEKPTVNQGRLETRKVLHLTLTFDHEVVDGAPAARFASRLKELVERGPDPEEWESGSCSIPATSKT